MTDGSTARGRWDEGEGTTGSEWDGGGGTSDCNRPRTPNSFSPAISGICSHIGRGSSGARLGCLLRLTSLRTLTQSRLVARSNGRTGRGLRPGRRGPSCRKDLRKCRRRHLPGSPVSPDDRGSGRVLGVGARTGVKGPSMWTGPGDRWSWWVDPGVRLGPRRGPKVGPGPTAGVCGPSSLSRPGSTPEHPPHPTRSPGPGSGRSDKRSLTRRRLWNSL